MLFDIGLAVGLVAAQARAAGYRIDHFALVTVLCKLSLSFHLTQLFAAWRSYADVISSVLR